MKKIISLADKLDKLGKFQASDNLTKIAQEKFLPEVSTTGKSRLLQDVPFDATAIGKKTQGLAPELSSAGGRNEINTFRLPNFRDKQELFKTQDGINYYNTLMQGFGENLIQMSQGLGINSLLNMVRSIVGALQGTPATYAEQTYKNVFDPTLTSELERIVITESPEVSLQAFEFVDQNIKFAAVQETYRNAISGALMNLKQRFQEPKVQEHYRKLMMYQFFNQYEIQAAV